MTTTPSAPAPELTEAVAADIALAWLRDFADALSSGSVAALESLFAEDATWRDFMAFTWEVTNSIGREPLIPRLADLAKKARAGGFTLTPEQAPVLVDGDIQAFFDFTTEHRVDRGYVLLVRSGDEFVAATLQTQADRLQKFPESTRHHRRQGKVHGVVMNRTRWTDDRRKEAAFEESDPAVVVLGAGHNGLSIAARLTALDVPTLVIHGTEDRMLPAANGRMIARLIPGARLVELEGVGHMFWWEQPERVVDLLAEFVLGVPAEAQ